MQGAMDAFIHFGIAAAAQAVQDAGAHWGVKFSGRAGRTHRLRDRLGHRGLALIENTPCGTGVVRPRRITPFFVPGLHHQHGGGTCFHALWLTGNEPFGGDEVQLQACIASARRGALNTAIADVVVAGHGVHGLPGALVLSAMRALSTAQ